MAIRHIALVNLAARCKAPGGRYVFITGGVVSWSSARVWRQQRPARSSRRVATRSACASSTSISTSIRGPASPYQHGGCSSLTTGRDRPRPRPLRALHRQLACRQTTSPRAHLPGHPRQGRRGTISAPPSRSFRTSPTRSRTSSGEGNDGYDSCWSRSAARSAYESLPFLRRSVSSATTCRATTRLTFIPPDALS